MPGHFASLFCKFFALFSLLYTSASFLLEISSCFDTNSAHLRRAVPPSGRGRCTIIYNKKSICCLHRANGCSLLYITVTSGHPVGADLARDSHQRRTEMKRILLSRIANIRSSVSSPGMPNITSTPSASRQSTSTCAVVFISFTFFPSQNEKGSAAPCGPRCLCCAYCKRFSVIPQVQISTKNDLLSVFAPAGLTSSGTGRMMKVSFLQ